MKFGGPRPRTPTEYVQAIDAALDADDMLIVNFYVKQFSLVCPTAFAQYRTMILNGGED